jgi:hypothetical protein
MVKKLLSIIFLLTFSTALLAQEDDAKDLEILESALIGIHEVVASPNPFSVATRIRYLADEEFMLRNKRQKKGIILSPSLEMNLNRVFISIA